MRRLFKTAAPMVVAGLLVACGGSSSTTLPMPTPTPAEPDPVVVEVMYTVTVTNLTNAQPLSPVAVVLHQDGSVFEIGQAASAAVEQMAESGDNAGILGADIAVSNATNGDILMPGMHTEIMITTTDEAANKLSLTTMLVNTNDAFSGLNAVDLSHLAVGDSMMLHANIYDAGTEANSEMSGTIPGPADGGEGFNEARDDVNYVAMHPGVVSLDDGATSSVLTGDHKFDNPGMVVKIERTQ